METKDYDAIQMIEDSIEGIKGLDGYKEDKECAVVKCVKDAMGELVGNNGDTVSIPMPPLGPIDPRPVDFDPDHRSQDNLPPAQRFVDPRPAQKPQDNPVSNQRLIDHDKMNDLMRIMRVEMEKREMGEAKRVSDAVEQAGGTDGSTKRNYRDYLLQQ